MILAKVVDRNVKITGGISTTVRKDEVTLNEVRKAMFVVHEQKDSTKHSLFHIFDPIPHRTGSVVSRADIFYLCAIQNTIYKLRKALTREVCENLWKLWT